MLELKNPSEEDQNKIFTAGSTDAMSILGGADDYFSMSYTLLPGQTGQFGLLFTVDPGVKLHGVDLGAGFPLFLVK